MGASCLARGAELKLAPDSGPCRRLGPFGAASWRSASVLAMPGLLDDKVVAITGASSRRGHRAGSRLGGGVGGARRAPHRPHRGAGGTHRRRPRRGPATDITDEESARAFIAETRERLGRLDVLVNNAGVMLLGPVEGAATEHWRRMVEVNLLGLLYCTHAALPVMREAGEAHCQPLLDGRTHRLPGQRGLQPDQVGGVWILRRTPSGGPAGQHQGHHRRAGLRRDRAAGPQRAPVGGRGDGADAREDRQGPGAARHRRRRASSRSPSPSMWPSTRSSCARHGRSARRGRPARASATRGALGSQ